MSKDSFTFKQFSVHQDRCAMKVGTDGTLLGAWTFAPNAECRILDIGTGTGLIALMMAQRYPRAFITAIDIDSDACAQAKENVNNSPYKDRIEVICCDIRDYESDMFDVIVSNPPYFNNSLECPDSKRSIARHSVILGYDALINSVRHLLKDNGTFSMIAPTDSVSRIESAAVLSGLFLSRKYNVRTLPDKAPKRCLLEFSKMFPTEIEIRVESIETTPKIKSNWYNNLTKDFYL